MKKRLLAFTLALTLAAGLVGCGTTPSPNENTGGTAVTDATKQKQGDTLMGSTAAATKFKVGTTTAPEGHYVKGLLEMQKRLEGYSSGKITLDIYPNSQLGNERDMMENIGMGVQDMCLISTGPIPNFVPDFAVLDLPYLFNSAQDAYSVLDGEVGNDLLSQLSAQNIKGLGFWENGFREVTNNKKAIVVPEDLKGMKIRTMENSVHMATYKALGATATPMAWGEIFTALQQGTVDGQENPIAIIESAKVYEVQKHVSMIDLFYSPCVLMIGLGTFEKMAAEEQAILVKAADEAKLFQREFSQSYVTDALKTMSDANVTVTEVDTAVWKAAVQSVYDNADSLGLNPDLIAKITK